MRISKELFVKTIKEIERVQNFYSDLHELLRKYETDGDAPVNADCSGALVDILDTIFTPDNDDNVVYDNISWFVYEGEFGKNVHPGSVMDDDVDVSDSFTSAEKLYDYLCNHVSD